MSREWNSTNAEQPTLPPRRLFLGLRLPEFVRGKVAGLLGPDEPVRAVSDHNLHLTLRFYGEVETELADTLIERLAELRQRQFLLHLEGVGCFPNAKKPQVLWTGVGRGHPHLFGLWKQIEDVSVNLGFPIDRQRFVPHVTLGRCGGVSPEVVRQWLKRNRDFGTAPFPVDEFVLFRSRRPGAGREPEYQVVHTFPLDP